MKKPSLYHLLNTPFIVCGDCFGFEFKMLSFNYLWQYINKTFIVYI